MAEKRAGTLIVKESANKELPAKEAKRFAENGED